MNRIIITLLAAMTLAAPLMAQKYDRAVADNIWSTGSNVNGLRQDSSRVSISFAELHAGIESGEFRRSNAASSLWEAGAEAAGIKHLDRFSMKGGFSFAQQQGSDMCGSMFIEPGFYPVDVLEFTPGDKTLQTYAFDGGVSVDLTPMWRVGAMMDFESSNYSKRKDLRHTNYRLDMTIAPGLMFHMDDIALGLSYIYKRNSETVSAEQVGTGADTYYAFLDKGLMYGTMEPWTGSGVHLSEAGVSGFPVQQQYSGLAFQWQAKESFQELEWLRGSGRIGEKQNIWFRFPSQKLTFRWNDAFELGGLRHYSRCFLSWEKLSNYESVLEKVTSNGVSNVTELAQNQILSQRVHTFGFEYEFVGEKREVLIGGQRAVTSSVASQMYPYITGQTLVQRNVYMSWLRHFGRFDVNGTLDFANGKVSETLDLDSEKSGVVTSPKRLEEFYLLDMEYKTARKLTAGLRARWHMRGGIYLEARGDVLKGFNLQYAQGSMRYGAQMGIGYEF